MPKMVLDKPQLQMSKQAEKRCLPTARECYRYQIARTDHAKLGCPLRIHTTYGYSKGTALRQR